MSETAALLSPQVNILLCPSGFNFTSRAFAEVDGV